MDLRTADARLTLTVTSLPDLNVVAPILRSTINPPRSLALYAAITRADFSAFGREHAVRCDAKGLDDG
jgi:hypothetical protein